MMSVWQRQGRDATPSDFRVTWLGGLVALFFVGLTAVVCARGVDQACHNAEPPVAVPVRGTPRAAYCDTLEHLPLVPTLISVPLLLTALVLFVWKRKPIVAIVLAVGIAVLSFANLVLAISLEHSVTI